jgi:hypothetical protein
VRKGVNSARDRALGAAWLEGVPLSQIAADLGLSKPRVSTVAKALGLPQRQPRPTASDRAAFKQLYASGLTVAEVAERTGWHRDTVTRALTIEGVEIQSGADRARRWPVRHDAFSPPLAARTALRRSGERRLQS